MTALVSKLPQIRIPVRPRQYALLNGISWDTYRQLRQECDRDHLKMTFDRGALEIMSPLPEHAIVTRFIDLMITVVSEELNTPVVGFRDTTWQKQAADRGLEADDCYYVQHVDVAEKRGGEIDIDRDPPPDVAIETDITNSSVDKEAVYAAMGIPELWRWDDGKLRVRLLGRDKTYADAARSAAFPSLPVEVVEWFINRRLQGESEWSLKKEFRAWAQTNLARSSESP